MIPAISIAAQLVALGVPLAQEIIDAVNAEMTISGSNTAPTADQQAILDNGLDAAHKALQAAIAGGSQEGDVTAGNVSPVQDTGSAGTVASLASVGPSASATVDGNVPWANKRPWRNNNPLDLRCLPLPQKWAGQSGIDGSPGGPFAIFDNRVSGWRAGVVCLLAYQDKHGINTIDGIVNRWAPGSDGNDTEAYGKTVSQLSGFGVSDVLNMHDGNTMLKLVTAMAVVEGGSDITWPETEKLAGIKAAGLAITSSVVG